jgi:phosphoribosylformylglycinamidine synthase
MIVGSATGKDGIHGATFASEEISNESEAKRPAVQVGDPFMEKLLLEATLEAIQEGLVIGIQDMGAAGLTCSSTEMSAKGKSGMKLYLERVPLREKGMNSYEIMLSESQERMLLVAKKEDEEKLLKIFKKWDLSASTIGEVTDNHIVEVYHHGALKASVPAYSLVLGEGAPVYQREAVEPTYLKEVRSFDGRTITEPRDYTETFLSLLQSPIIGSKRWVFEQYDHMVRTNTVIEPGSSDAAIIRIKGTDKALALKTDCNSRYVYLHPRRGGEIAVAEATRNVVCSGAKPLAITNCLNFGNPYDPEIYWQFREAVLGIGTACRVLETPVTGGNVSFYNEGPTAAVYPTPVIGMLGLVESLEHVMTSYFKDSGDLIILLGKPTGEIGGSEYLFQRTGKLIGDAPSIDLMYEKLLQEFCLTLIHRGLIKSAHDVSEGGLIVSLFESCLNPFQLLGIRVEGVPIDGLRSDFALFGESQGMIIVSASSHHAKHVIDAARSVKVPAYVIGEVTTDGRFSVEGLIDVELEVARNLYEKAIPKAIGEERA